MEKSRKKKMKYLVFFSPFLIFVFFLVILGAALGGGLEEEMEKNDGKIESVVGSGNAVLASSLTSENTVGHTFVGEVEIRHRGAFKALNLIMAVKVKQNTEFKIFSVKGKEREFITLHAAEASSELQSFTVSVNVNLDNTNFLAINATDSTGAETAWEIYTIAFITGGE